MSRPVRGCYTYWCVVDAYARRIFGWRASMSMCADLALDTIEQAILTRRREGVTDLAGVRV
jgi:putative transposase